MDFLFSKEITPDYQNEKVKLFNQDCLDILPCIPDNSIDLIVVDTPYHITKGGGGITKDGKKYCGGMIGHYGTDTENARKGKLFEYNNIEFKEWLPQAFRILKENTHCYVFINARNLLTLWQCAKEVGFKFQQLLVWDKGNSTPTQYYMNSYELILMLRKGRAKYIHNLGTSNILRIPNILRIKQHPTQKPISLLQILIENSSNVKDIVLDMFMGSGSTGVSCLQSDRNFIGCEIDQKYFKIAQDRITNKL